jgi:amidase
MEARELAQQIRRKEVSCVDVMQAHLAQIERVNPTVNAIVTLLPEVALKQARAADEAMAAATLWAYCMVCLSPIKTSRPRGIRTTYGSHIRQSRSR